MSARKKPLLLMLEPDRFSPQARLTSFTNLHEGPFTRAHFLKAVAKAEILWVRLGHRIDKEALAATPHLRCIVSPTTGLNHIDMNVCAQRGIRVLSLRGELRFLRSVTATAEHTLGLILALLRQTIPAHRSVCEGAWDRNQFIGRQASNLTLGIIGLGRLGSILGRISKPLFRQVLGHDPFVSKGPAGISRVSLERLLSTSDVISLHVHSSPQTHHLIGAKAFCQMKRGAYLVNTSRGDVLDEGALLHALKQRTLAGAALDVLENEHQAAFTPRKQPLVNYARLHANVIVTPHVGGATSESLSAAESYMVDQLHHYLLKTKFLHAL